MAPKKSFTVLSAFVFLFLSIILPLSQHSALASSGDIHTFAGLGRGYAGDGGAATAAFLNSPGAVAIDASGNVYISDRANQRIRKVDTAGKISTVAGTGRPGFSGDGGAAAQARIKNPSGIAVDGAGDILFADMGNSRIRMINPSGAITTVAGTGRPGYSGDGGPASSASINHAEGVAVDAKGNIYISDTGNNRVRMISPAGIITTIAGTGRPGYAGDGGPATSARLNRPAGVAVDSSGRIYVADCYNRRVRVIDASGVITTLAGTGRAGYFGDGGPAASARLNFPSGVAVDASGNVYIADWHNQRVRMVDASGTITTLAGTGRAGFSGDGSAAGGAMLGWPFGVAVDSSGDVFIADSRNNRIRMVEGQSYALPVSTITSPEKGMAYSNGSGLTITGTASAKNGVSFVEVSTDGGTTWNTASGTTSWSYSWNPPQKGLYLIMSRATDSQGKNETIVNCQRVKAVIKIKHVAISVALTPNQPEATPGQTVAWTAAASGGSGNYQYQFLRRGPDTGGTYALMQDWSGSDTWNWNVGSSSVGDNTIMVNIMDSPAHAAQIKNTLSSSHGKVSKTAPFKVNKTATTNPATPIVVNSLAASVASPATAGNAVAFTASASGGSGNLQYQFMRMGPDTGGAYALMQDWSGSSSYNWSTTSSMAGTNTIMVNVRNSDGSGTVSKSITYTIVQAVTAIVIGSITPSIQSPGIVGTPVTWTTSASGGSGTYQYQFSRTGPDTGGTAVITRTWGTSNTWTWNTTSAMTGTNTITISARDGSGNTTTSSVKYTLTSASTGNSYYISPTGSDTSGNGSITSPWLTWAHASSHLKSGDTLYARGGTYYNQGGWGTGGTANWYSASGTQTAPITFKAYPGETPVFDGGATATSNSSILSGYEWTGGVGVGLCFSNSISWVVVDGIVFQHYSFDAAIIAADWGGGGASNIVIQNCTIHDCGGANATSSGDNQDHAIYLGAGTANFTIRNNLIYNIAAGGIQGWHAPGASNIVMYNNVISACRFGILFGDGANGLYAYNNTINHCNYGIDYGQAGDTDPVGVYNAVVENNILTDNAVCGLRVGSFDSTQVSSDYNLYYGNASDIIWAGTSYKLAGFQSAKPETSGSELHSISANPSFASPGSNYQPASGSPAIGAGTTISAVPYNYDYVTRQIPYNIGAY